MKFLWYGNVCVPESAVTFCCNALARAGHTVVRYPRLEGKPFPLSEIIRYATTYQVQCFILSAGAEMTASDIYNLRDRRPSTVICVWHWDWMGRDDVWPWFELQAKAADICFVADGTEESRWDGINRVFIPQGVDTDVYFPVEEINTEDEYFAADIAFTGTNYEMGSRREVLAKVEEWAKQNGKVFKIWNHQTHHVLGSEFQKVVGLSKIMIGHLGGGSNVKAWGARIYETLACDGFLLQQKAIGIESEFTDCVHLRFWQTTEELLNLINKYLAPRMTRTRERIAHAGWNLVTNCYSWDDRVMQAMKSIRTIAK